MNANVEAIRKKIRDIGLGSEAKYRFVLGPQGLPLAPSEKKELEAIGRAAHEYVQTMDTWYRSALNRPAGSWLASVLGSAIPKGTCYRNFAYGDELPVTFMVDTVYTSEGWRVVEVDVTNRNAYGYPLIMRHLYNLPSIWKGIDAEWIAQGYQGVTQIMARHHRYYDPYFRFFLSKLEGRLVREDDLERFLLDMAGQDTRSHKLLDLPVMYWSRAHLPKLAELASQARVGIPPKHYLSSKALTVLPWEANFARDLALTRYLPEGRLVCNTRPLPQGDFFLKLMQSGGTHGTFQNDTIQLQELHDKRKPRAIWQKSLPLARRRVQYCTEDGVMQEGDFYVRISIFVNREGSVVDADATCSPDKIIHGSTRSIMTIPVFKEDAVTP